MGLLEGTGMERESSARSLAGLMMAMELDVARDLDLKRERERAGHP